MKCSSSKVATEVNKIYHWDPGEILVIVIDALYVKKVNCCQNIYQSPDKTICICDLVALHTSTKYVVISFIYKQHICVNQTSQQLSSEM